MVEIARIVCPVDLSEFSRSALAHALALADWYETEVAVLHVHTPPGAPVVAKGFSANIPPPREAPAAVRSEVCQFVESVTAAATTPAVVIREGSPVREIVSYVEDSRPDLLVMGTHGRSGFERLLLGSVTEKVLRKVRCPVLTVPFGTPSARVQFKTILCPVDFSDCSIPAIEWAMSLAEECDARLILVHIVESPSQEAFAAETAHFTVPEYYRHLAREAELRLKAMVPDAARTWCEPSELVTTGKPYREILRLAEQTAAELIVMGVHGGGATIDRVLFGSTTEHVLRAARCPVLTIRPSR